MAAVEVHSAATIDIESPAKAFDDIVKAVLGAVQGAVVQPPPSLVTPAAPDALPPPVPAQRSRKRVAINHGNLVGEPNYVDPGDDIEVDGSEADPSRNAKRAHIAREPRIKDRDEAVAWLNSFQRFGPVHEGCLGYTAYLKVMKKFDIQGNVNAPRLVHNPPPPAALKGQQPDLFAQTLQRNAGVPQAQAIPLTVPLGGPGHPPGLHAFHTGTGAPHQQMVYQSLDASNREQIAAKDKQIEALTAANAASQESVNKLLQALGDANADKAKREEREMVLVRTIDNCLP